MRAQEESHEPAIHHHSVPRRYHWVFFTSINPAAWVFGAFFVAQSLVFLGTGVVRTRLRFRFSRDVFGFGIQEDYGLLVAGVLGTTMVIVKNRRLSQADAPEMVPA